MFEVTTNYFATCITRFRQINHRKRIVCKHFLNQALKTTFQHSGDGADTFFNGASDLNSAVYHNHSKKHHFQSDFSRKYLFPKLFPLCKLKSSHGEAQ
jgi:hypothetical protein